MLYPHADTLPVISSSKATPSWQTIAGAIAQIYAMMLPSGDRNGENLWYPCVVKEKQQSERGQFDTVNGKLLTPDVVTIIKAVFMVWESLMNFAINERANVFDKGRYGRPNAVPYIEFIGIALIVAIPCIKKLNRNAELANLAFSVEEQYSMLRRVSQLRRYLRAEADDHGFRRQEDWGNVWKVLAFQGEDMGIKEASVWKVTFAAEPELFF